MRGSWNPQEPQARRRTLAGERVHEALELLGGPALEDAVAVGLVGGHHRVAVVPVQARLGVDPERAAGALATRRRRAARGARGRWCARRRARSPWSAGRGRPPPGRGTRARRGRSRCSRRRRRRRPRWRSARETARNVALALEDVGDLGDPLDEHEAAQLAERVVQRVQHREEEDARAGHAGGDVAEHVQLGPPRAAVSGT